MKGKLLRAEILPEPSADMVKSFERVVSRDLSMYIGLTDADSDLLAKRLSGIIEAEVELRIKERKDGL